MRTRDLKPCLAAVLALAAVHSQAAPAANSATGAIHGDQPGPRIDRDIFGQFSEHLGRGMYGGLWVGLDSPISNTRGFRNDVVSALRALGVPVLRWPGGCFADIYHWRDGIGPTAQRPVRLNGTWGGVEESNQVGIHEFMDLAGQLGADVYINGNLGTGTPDEMDQQLEYMLSDTGSSLAKERAANGHPAPWTIGWYGVGNEPWGCGGNMRPEYYADQVRQRVTFFHMPDARRAKLVASGGLPEDYDWTEKVMASAARFIDAYSMHYYTLPSGQWDHKGAAAGFTEDAWIATLVQARRMDDIIARHSAIMDKYDPAKRIALVVDEWGNWFDPTPDTNPAFLEQANTLRDAITAAITLNIFQRHADRVRMTEIAQTVNVLQAMVLTDGPRMALTPTYHVFALYRPFQDATALPVEISTPEYRHGGLGVPGVDAVAARDKAGVVHVALVNPDPEHPVSVSLALDGLKAQRAEGQVLTAPAMDSANSFAAPDTVAPHPFAGARVSAGRLSATLPAKSLVVLTLQ